MALFHNKYKVETTRLKNWDYGSNALYFITICTTNKNHFFGEIQNEEVILNDIGMVVQKEWLLTPSIRPDMNITLDEFVIMPNHFHGIICIGENEFNTCRDGMHPVSTPDKTTKDDNRNKFGPQSKNLGSIMRGFKSSVSIQVRKSTPDFGWQERYHDHIIRDQDSYLRIRQYILNNPRNWKEDKFYSE